MTTRPPTRYQTRAATRNRFEIGLFGMNRSGGMSLTKAPERWQATWDNMSAAALIADDIGLDFLMPLGRWKGYPGETDRDGAVFETVTWATGLLAITKAISVFGTVHVAFFHPVLAAKQCVAADLVGQGRFGLNIVAGWNTDEFGMFGIELRDSADRYAYSEEWVRIVERLWLDPEPFDFDGRFFTLKNAGAYPKPHAGQRPLIMSAGSSGDGRAFALRNADCLFMGIPPLDELAQDLRGIRAQAPERDFGLYAQGHVVCRRNQKEAEDFYRHVVYDHGDMDLADKLIAARVKGGSRTYTAEQWGAMKEELVAGVGTFKVVGSADHVAETFKRMSDAGLDGMAFALINYLDDLPFLREELLPRMTRLGLRSPLAQRRTA